MCAPGTVLCSYRPATGPFGRPRLPVEVVGQRVNVLIQRAHRVQQVRTRFVAQVHETLVRIAIRRIRGLIVRIVVEVFEPVPPDTGLRLQQPQREEGSTPIAEYDIGVNALGIATRPDARQLRRRDRPIGLPEPSENRRGARDAASRPR